MEKNQQFSLNYTLGIVYGIQRSTRTTSLTNELSNSKTMTWTLCNVTVKMRLPIHKCWKWLIMGDKEWNRKKRVKCLWLIPFLSLFSSHPSGVTIVFVPMPTDDGHRSIFLPELSLFNIVVYTNFYYKFCMCCSIFISFHLFHSIQQFLKQNNCNNRTENNFYFPSFV